MPIDLGSPVQFVKGVGPVRSQELKEIGIVTVEDLLRYPPFRYEDRSHYCLVKELREGEEGLISGVIQAAGQRSSRNRRVSIFQAFVRDESGQIPVIFFNQPYLKRVIRNGVHVVLFGVPRVDTLTGKLSFVNPEMEFVTEISDPSIHTGRIVPVYRKTGSLTTRQLRAIIFRILQQLNPDIKDPLPDRIRQKWGFPFLFEAFQELHFPGIMNSRSTDQLVTELNRNGTPSQLRFVFEEFFSFQLGLELMRKKRVIVPKKREIRLSPKIRERIKSILPFHPTPAQKKVVKEIIDDLTSKRVMHRLLQGDVGSGKTIVALQAMVVVIENGFQTALMVPTEILAEQHFETVAKYLKGTPYRCALLVGSMKGAEKQQVLRQASLGELDLIVGTHALIQKNVRFLDLGLVIVDEQHRFGVSQRSHLIGKGQAPDILVMTATPIPRSLALTVYGDLDLSVLDELPPGRKPVKTVVKTEKSREEVYQAIQQEVRKGRQAFIVFPLVDESEKLDIRAATIGVEKLQKEIFPELVIGLIHGRLGSDEKDRLMNDFAAGRIQILAATTVIEVGIDIPNATIMMIENAERFGLSQLHQLRGRIGRGQYPGTCILMVDSIGSQDAMKRLDIMRKSSDGFEIAEKDLEIRGPGEFLGTRQSGIPAFRFANIVRDRKWLELARNESERYLDEVIEQLSSKKGLDRSKILNRLLGQWKRRYQFLGTG